MVQVAIQNECSDGIGWAGPNKWPSVLKNRVAPFSSLWLTRVNSRFDQDLAKQLPRAVASPMFHGKPRYDFVCVKIQGEGNVIEDWIGRVVMFFVAHQQHDDDDSEWEELAYVRWARDVEETDFEEHSKIDIRNDSEVITCAKHTFCVQNLCFDTYISICSQVIWKRIEHANQAGIKMMCWSTFEEEGFQPYPYTTGWQVINCASISHRVLMQPVNHDLLGGFYWMNPTVYR